MPGCSTGRNIQKYKGAAASTLQDVTDNGNTTTGDLITTSGFFIGDGSLLTGISGASSAFSFQDTSDRGNTTSNTIQFTNTITSLTTSGNVIVAGNVTASSFYGLGTGISEIDPNSLTSAVSISKGGTGSTTATGAASALGVGTEDSPQFTGIELGHASDTTLLRVSPGVVTIQGQTIRTGDVALGTQTSGNYVKTITVGDGLDMSGSASEGSDHTLSLDLKSNHGLVIDNTELKIDLKPSGGLQFDSGQMRVKLDDTSINGTLPVSKGGTGTTTLDNLISLGSHTTGNYVKTVTAGNGLDISGSAGEGSDHTLSLDLKANHGLVIDNTELKIDLKASGGLQFDSGQMRVKLDDNAINGTLPVSKGGTGFNSSSGLTHGDILFVNSSGTFSNLAADSGKYLKSFGSGADPGWRTVSEEAPATAGSLAAGDGLTSDQGAFNGSTGTVFSIDPLSAGGLVFDGNTTNNKKLKVDLGGTSITGTVAIGHGGTGSTTASGAASALGVGTEDSPQFTGISLGSTAITESSGTVSIGGSVIRTGDISLGTDTTGNYVKTVIAGNGLDMSGSAGEGSDHTLSLDLKANHGLVIDSTELKIDLKPSGGLEFDSGKMRVKLDDANTSGKLPVNKGGTANDTFTDGGVLYYDSTSGKLVSTAASTTTGQVIKSDNNGFPVWGTDATGGSGSGSSVWLQSGSDPNYIVTTPTPQSNVGISNTYEVTHTLHIGSNVIVSDTGGHDVLRVNGNVFCTNYLFGDGSKIRNLNTIRTETGANQISVGSDDGGPVLSWRDRQIRYQYGTTGRPVPPGYGF